MSYADRQAREHGAGAVAELRSGARRVAGQLRRAARGAIERSLHPRRRTGAMERLRGLGAVERVLFVCHGNIYRSPFAEAAFRAMLPEGLSDRISALSAGFVGPERPAPDASIALAREQGFDLSAHRSQLLTPALVKEAQLVVVMSAAQQDEICRRFNYPRRRVLVLGDLDPDPIRSREVMDPWNRPYEVLVDSTRRVTRCVGELIGVLSEQGPPRGA